MYIYIYIYIYTNVCVYICIDIYIYIKCANSTWKRERQLVQVRWLEKERWLQLEESSPTWKSHRLPKCATWKNCVELNLSFLCATLKKCADLNLTFFFTYLHPTYGPKGCEQWSWTPIHQEVHGPIWSEWWSQHIQISILIHGFIDRSIGHGRDRRSIGLHSRKNTVDIDGR